MYKSRGRWWINVDVMPKAYWSRPEIGGDWKQGWGGLAVWIGRLRIFGGRGLV